MKSVTTQAMRDIEDAAFSQGITAEYLMDIAGLKIAETLLRYYPHTQQVTAYLGKGHNAGDALVALTHLREAGWDVNLTASCSAEELAPLTQQKLAKLGDSYLFEQIAPQPGSLIIDALVGIGASGALREPLAELALEINSLRNDLGCTVVALDIPSGVDADTGAITEGAVLADHTLSIGFPKAGILASQAISHVGAISHLTLDLLEEPADSKLQLITPQTLTRKRRDFDTHKGQMGRIGIWAGSEGMLGAAVLTATASLKAGAGLVTAFVPHTLYPVLATMMPHEVIVKPALDPRVMLDLDFDAIIIGPGIGDPVPSLADRLLFVAENCKMPLVLDADMLNLIAREDKLSLMHDNCILTPHPGEMLRLFPQAAELDRETTISKLSSEIPSTIVYKGARTLITQNNDTLHVNSSGTPAMATAGQGDVLAGFIASFCAQGYTNLEASKLATWIAGEAAQLALASGQHTEETLTASTLFGYMAPALDKVITTNTK